MKILLALLITTIFAYGFVEDIPVNCLPFNENGTINQNCQKIKELPFTQFSALNELVFKKYIKKGWNLVNLPSNFELNSPNITIVYSYNTTTKGWEYYSNTTTISSLSQLSTIDTNKGYWVYAKEDFEITYTNPQSTNIDYTNLENGWHLFGTFGVIEDFQKLGLNSKLIWIYKDGIWKVAGIDTKYQKLVANSSYEMLKYIPMKSGYWLLIKKNIPPVSNFSIFPAKTQYYLNEQINLNATSNDSDEDNMSYKWNIDNQSNPSITTFYTTAGTKTIELTTTDDKNESNTISKNITVIDQVKEPDLSSLLSSPKVYTDTDTDSNIAHTITISQYGSNSIKLLSNQISLNSNFVPSLSDTTEYIFTWTGKGYEGNYSRYNNIVYQGKYSSSYDLTIKIDKEKDFTYLDCFNKQIQTKYYSLYTISTSSDSNTQYFVDINLDDAVEVPKSYYDFLLTQFETRFDTLPIVVDTDTPADIVSQIFQDLGF